MTEPSQSSSVSGTGRGSGSVLSCDPVFLGLCALLVVVNLPLFFGLTSFSHDTLFYYQGFHNTYNNCLHAGEVPQWFPHTVFGMPTDFLQLVLLTAVDYSVLAVGVLFRIENALAVYKASLFLAQLIFLSGMYVLCRGLYRSRVAIFFACACSAGSLVLPWQIHWGFTVFYLLPWILHFGKRCFVERDVRYLLYAAIVAILSMVGTVPYTAIIVLLELACLGLVVGSILYLRERKVPVLAVRGGINLLLGGVGVILGVSYLVACMYDRKFLEVMSEGRDLQSYRIPLDTFLSYGGGIGGEKFLDLVLPRIVRGVFSDFSLFSGFLALLFILYAACRVRRAGFLAVGILVVLLGWFSLGGGMSRLLYHVIPGMAYFRHIGLSVSAFRVFLPLMAGFGIDYLLQRMDPSVLFRWRVLIVLALPSGMGVFYVLSPDRLARAIAGAGIMLALAIPVFLFIFLRRRHALWHCQCIIVAGICLETVVFQALSASQFHFLSKHKPERFSALRPPAFQLTRTVEPPSPDAREDYRFLCFLMGRYGTVYVPAYEVLQWDPCVIAFRNDFMSRSVVTFLRQRGARVGLNSMTLPKDEFFLKSAGCGGEPKLRLVSQVTYAETEEDAVAQLRDASGDAVVLNGVPTWMRRRGEEGVAAGGTINVVHFSANRLEADVNLAQGESAWLYYADGFHPSWKATVNGISVPVVQANVGFKAVQVDRGRSRIVFRYDNVPKRIASHILISAGMLLTGLFTWTVVRLARGSR